MLASQEQSGFDVGIGLGLGFERHALQHVPARWGQRIRVSENPASVRILMMGEDP